MIKKNCLNKLSIQISAVIILFGALALLTFSFLYYNKDYFFNFVLDLGIISDNTETYATKIENKLIDNNVSINDINAIDEILGSSEIYSVSIYNADDNIVYENIVINPNNETVLLDGKPVELTYLEYQILYLLVSNRQNR